MAKIIDKIVKSKNAPQSTNVLWDDGENLKIYRNGVWENTNSTEIKEGSIPLSALSKEVRDKINISNIPAKYLIVESPGSFINPTFTKIDDSSIKCDLEGCSIAGLIQEVKYPKGNVLIDCIRDGFIKLDTGDNLNGYEEEVFILREKNDDELIFEYVDGDDIDSAIAKLSTYKFYGWDSSYAPAKIPQALINMPYIDPVVWKYICDPFVIKYYSETGEIGSTPIPIELYNIIWDKDNECLRNIVCKVLIVKITTANDISINSVNGIIDKTIINCVNNTQLEFIPYDRSFIER